MKYKAVLFDFFGVVSRSNYYHNQLLPEWSHVYDWIQEHVFGDPELLNAWMRNNVSSAEVHARVSMATGLAEDRLMHFLEESLRTLEMEQDMLGLVHEVKAQGVRTGLVTDNVEVFSTVLVPYHGFDVLFDTIVNSADHGLLKREEGGRLFDIALKNVGVNCFADALFIDDLEVNTTVFRQKGGFGFCYQNNFEDLFKHLEI